jgi:hypothetical protein
MGSRKVVGGPNRLRCSPTVQAEVGGCGADSAPGARRADCCLLGGVGVEAKGVEGASLVVARNAVCWYPSV